MVSYTELLYSGQVLASYTHLLIQTFLVVALIYLAVNASLSKLARVLQARDGRRIGRRGRRTAELPPPLVEGNLNR
ncbi:hypothetical protein GCM10027614_64560 [Micromonospora vulcania]